MARGWSSNYSNQSRNWDGKSNLLRQKYSLRRNKETPLGKWRIWKFEWFRCLDRHHWEHRYHSRIILRRNKMSAPVRIEHGYGVTDLPKRLRKYQRIHSIVLWELSHIPALEPANLPRSSRGGVTQLYSQGYRYARSFFFANLHCLLAGPQHRHPRQPGHNNKLHQNRHRKLIW